MELVYLYIKESSRLKNQNLNFGSEYIFNYSSESEYLEAVKNDLFIRDHYKSKDHSGILNITSIIGQNGTGKTSILNFIRYNFAEGMRLDKPAIFIIKVKDEFVIYHTEDLPVTNQLKGFEKNAIKLEREPLRGKGINGEYLVTLGYNFKGFKNTDLIYFSNIFDSTGGSFDLKGIYDISTNNLIFEDFSREIKNQGIIVRTENNSVLNFINNELHRQIKFIHKFYNSQELPFELPTELGLKVKNDFFKLQSNTILESRNPELYTYIIKLIERSQQTSLVIEQAHEKIKFHIIVNIYLSFLVDFYLSHQGVDDLVDILGIPDYNSDTKIQVSDLLENINYVSKKFQSHLSNDYEGIQFECIKSLIGMIASANDGNDALIWLEGTDLKLSISKKEFPFFENFMKLYTGSIFIRPFLNFSWRHISSGEKALLNIYSRFNSLADGEIFGEKLNDHLIILIDEGDLYLHPQWQKSFVKILLDFLPVIFQNRTIQLIFTTNSPIPASDLLSYNTIFLEKHIDGDGNYVTIVKDSLNEQKETFAANIHTLLSDSFFVDNGLIGDFATLKIDEIIERLVKRTELSYEEREDMRKLIHQIGEPILKNKLMQMYNDRYNLEIHERLERIERRLEL